MYLTLPKGLSSPGKGKWGSSVALMVTLKAADALALVSYLITVWQFLEELCKHRRFLPKITSTESITI